MKQWTDLQKYYDYRSADYAREHANELGKKPLDRELLIRFSRMVNSDAPVCEVGCGPGQISRYLFETGVRDIFGVDISPEMI
ncbi:MAG: methyltransferase domain-containing protein, partial [Desulfobacteraceae bacterium]|nr:methyltransferase domain-containing protein [Desulfobacteraceae bacterium]